MGIYIRDSIGCSNIFIGTHYDTVLADAFGKYLLRCSIFLYVLAAGALPISKQLSIWIFSSWVGTVIGLSLIVAFERIKGRRLKYKAGEFSNGARLRERAPYFIAKDLDRITAMDWAVMANGGLESMEFVREYLLGRRLLAFSKGDRALILSRVKDRQLRLDIIRGLTGAA